MIKTNIWVFFVFYLIYALISTPLFLLTSGGWMGIFFYLGIVPVYYLITSALLFFKAAVRTRKHRTKLKIHAASIFGIIALQLFVVLFNYGNCGDSVCYDGFLPTLLEDSNIPILFSPTYTVVLFALLLYLCLLSLFLVDVAWKGYSLRLVS